LVTLFGLAKETQAENMEVLFQLYGRIYSMLLVRPQKLKRNRKYVELTISKVLGTPSRGVSRGAGVKEDLKLIRRVAFEIERSILWLIEFDGINDCL